MKGKGYRTLTISQAKKLLLENPDAVLVDTRPAQEYASGTLPGSLSLPEGEMDEKAEALLPRKDVPVLVYCRSGACSWLSAQHLAELGYTRVYDVGGYLEWKLLDPASQE